MRPHAPLVALLLLAPLAGCLGGGSATAQQLAPRARALAQAWQPDAVLEGIVTAEVGELPPIVRAALAEAGTQSPEAQIMQYRDGNVGNGRAGAWVFAFRSGSRELALALDSSGAELLRHEGSAHGQDAPAIAGFAIDSDRAMELAARHNGTFDRLRGRAAVATLALVPGPAGPLWALALAAGFGDGRGADAEAAFALVDATTGNVSAPDDLDGAFGPDSDATPMPAMPSPHHSARANRTVVKTEMGSQRGLLTAASPGQDAPFQVQQAGHSTLRLRLDLPRAAPPTQATATVTAPDGRTVHLAFVASLTPGAPATATLQSPPPGAYQVAVHLDSGVAQQYDLSWCAPGARLGKESASTCGDS